ncbi:hypothetical protein J4403_00140 [Candidatus Woesearchaeota archaeon]|nr:hypothetical protein [Candidatus Woesearchaeota archaeon]
MPILSFNINKIDLEKKESTNKPVNVKSNLNVVNVKEANIEISKEKQPLADVSFEFLVTYEPNVGLVKINGSLLYTHEAKKVKKFIEDWKKKKDVDKDIMETILNTCLSRCSIKALYYEQEVGLPPHLKLPRVSQQDKAKDYIG